MKFPMRLICVATAVFAGAALAWPETLYAGPRIGGVSLSKKPAVAKPDGFEAGPNATTVYQVDPTSTLNEIVFTSKAPKETIKGKTTKATGHLELNPRKLDSVAGSFTVLWKDIDTGNPMRNQHMVAAPWVNADSHPNIMFTVNEFELSKTQPAPPTKPNKNSHALKGKLIGTMSMNGKEKPMKITATLAYVEAGDGQDGDKVKEGIGIKAKFAVALEDFDIQGKGVGQAVAKKEQINVSLFLAKSDGSSANKSGDAEKPGKKKSKKDKKDEES